MKSARKSIRAKRVAIVGDVAILVVSKNLADLLEKGDLSALSMGTGKGGGDARSNGAKNGRKNGVKAAKVAAKAAKAVKSEKNGVDKAKIEKAEKKLTAAKMRCRHSEADGTRCRNRSKGPRFHYLCDDHRDSGNNHVSADPVEESADTDADAEASPV